MRKTIFAMLVVTLAASPAHAQLGSLMKKADSLAKAYDDWNFTDAEEHELGGEISTKLRDKYGVVQDKAVHKYVTLVGSVLAQQSSRPNLQWTFIVLDTDGVNAFAAPGGFIHITRGALALIQNEAELADVLGHEIGHVTEKHTINAVKKAKAGTAVTNAAGKAARSDFLKQVGDAMYSNILENKYDRGDETAADQVGVKLANAAGWAPSGLSAFLTRLAERNAGLKDRSGLFASHPETTSRIDAMKKTIAGQNLAAAALVQARYTQHITFKPVAVTAVAQVAPPTAAPAAPPASSTSGNMSTPPTAGGGLGLGSLGALGRDKSSTQTVSSAGSRGVNPDRDAKGGAIKTLVTVTVTAAEVTEFKKGIA